MDFKISKATLTAIRCIYEVTEIHYQGLHFKVADDALNLPITWIIIIQKVK